MNYLVRIIAAVLFSSMFLLSQAVYSADGEKIQIEGRVTSISESSGIIEIRGKKYRYRYSSVVLDENGKKSSEREIKDISEGTYVIVEARQEAPYPIVLTIRPQLT